MGIRFIQRYQPHQVLVWLDKELEAPALFVFPESNGAVFIIPHSELKTTATQVNTTA